MLVLSVAKAMSLDPASGAQDWDVRVGPLREVDSDMGKDTLRAFRLQSEAPRSRRARPPSCPSIDYCRDRRGRYIIYTPPRDVHKAVVGVKPVLLSESRGPAAQYSTVRERARPTIFRPIHQ